MTRFGKTIRWSVLSVVGAFATLAPAQAVPVVPNFTQGSMTSHTETTSKVTETINSMDYSTGYQYSTSGTGITASGNLSPGTGTNNVTIEGVTSSWTGATSTPTSHRQHQEQRSSLRKPTKDLSSKPHCDPA